MLQKHKPHRFPSIFKISSWKLKFSELLLRDAKMPSSEETREEKDDKKTNLSTDALLLKVSTKGEAAAAAAH